MQTVGKECSRCAERIRNALEAFACRDCKIAFHLECVEDPGVCPKCGADALARERALQAEDDAARDLAASPTSQGGTVAATVLVSLGAIQLLALGVDLIGGDMERVMRAVMRMVLTFPLLWYVWRGSKLARQILIGLLCLSVLGSILLIGTAPATGAGSLGMGIMIAVAFVFAASAAILAGHGATRSFLEARGRPPE